jgi:hypothetical protein
VLTLSSARPGDDLSLDMALSFDEGRPDLFSDKTGHYRISASPALSAVNYRWSRAGTGAALFSGDSPVQALTAAAGPIIISPRSPEALLYSDQHFKDFSIEFWLYPQNMESGEQVVSWSATRRTRQGVNMFQRIQCSAAKNRLNWSFLDFFSSPDDGRQMTITLSGSPVLPRTWSHHLIRFDSNTGLLEYLVDGRLEGVSYATTTGREGGEVYSPVAGDGGALVLGGRFAGMIDEFRVYSRYNETPQLSKYPLLAGRIETRPLDLGERNSKVLKVEALGGNFSPGGRNFSGGVMRNEYAGPGRFRFANNSMVQFFIRAADSPYQVMSGWQPFEPGQDFTGDIRGRYVWLAADFYPSGDGEAAPYVDEIRVVYQRDDPPMPPSMVTAVARDGAVDVMWKASPDADVSGYLVYFGTSSGEYFGESAIHGVSPIDVGKQTSVRIDGLKNGALYYFTVAGYDQSTGGRATGSRATGSRAASGSMPANAGVFSREVSARPLRMVE